MITNRCVQALNALCPKSVSATCTVRQLLSSGIITIDYVKSKDNIADPLTKGLTREMIAKTSRGMGLRPLNKPS